MPKPKLTVLVVGATGSIGRLVVEEALRPGHVVRALVRTPDKASQLPREAHIVVGDVTRADTLPAAVEGVDAIVFTLGSDGKGKVGAETVDYGGVRNVLRALGSRKAHCVDDLHRCHESRWFLQSLDRSPRLEAPFRKVSSRQWIAIHHCAARLV